MRLVSTHKMLMDAQAGGYAIGAFNIENMEMAQGVMEAATALNAPVILQTTPSTVKYASLALYLANATALARNAKVPAAMHLDHGDNLDLAAEAMLEGYTSVMIDGSHLSFNENIALTAKAVSFAKQKGIPVEAELGRVGGKEDDTDGGAGNYTDPHEAYEFTERTGVSSLAVAIGTAHGKYTVPPVLDINRLDEIRSKVKVPLVLHGASGLKDEDIRECIRRGICKVNFATELRIAFTQGVMEYLASNPKVIDPKKYGAVGRERVKKAVMDRIRICGCDGKGGL